MYAGHAKIEEEEINLAMSEGGKRIPLLDIYLSENLVVTSITRGGVVDRDGRVKVGDHLVQLTNQEGRDVNLIGM